MTFNDLLIKQGIDQRQVLVLRHRPPEPKLRKVLPWLAEVKPDVYNAYQQTQREKVEKSVLKASYVASFIGHEAGKALFVGLYSVGSTRRISRREFWCIPAYVEMRDKFGLKGLEPGRRSCLQFQLTLKDFYRAWKGKLIIDWPPPERSWARWASKDKNEFPIFAILDESLLVRQMPDWKDLILTWEELSVLPKSWRAALRQWPGIYYIFDVSDGKGYVGAASGGDNILGRWLNYADTGDGGNKLLRRRDPRNFRFSILQLTSLETKSDDLDELESCWKKRLHTHAPLGLNGN